VSPTQPYNDNHWNKRIRQYLDSDWSKRPTPFAKLVDSRIKPHSTILELGAGAGQDSLWFASQGHKLIMTDGSDAFFETIQERASEKEILLEARMVDVTQTLPFNAGTFDLVYAQLVLHYFDDDLTKKIIGEIERILKSGGWFAGMVNTVHDPEYDLTKEQANGLLNVNGLIKRFFTLESFRSFLSEFEIELYDAKGSTPKDDDKDTHDLIRFIARKV
jgi:SAM-dependent methyltransferase